MQYRLLTTDKGFDVEVSRTVEEEVITESFKTREEAAKWMEDVVTGVLSEPVLGPAKPPKTVSKKKGGPKLKVVGDLPAGDKETE
jgi:hypothetical protein